MSLRSRSREKRNRSGQVTGLAGHVVRDVMLCYVINACMYDCMCAYMYMYIDVHDIYIYTITCLVICINVIK